MAESEIPIPRTSEAQTAQGLVRGVGRLFARNDIWCLSEMPLRCGRRADLMGLDAKGRIVIVEIKVSRADLLGDLKKPAKRAAYLGMAGACWYVLGNDAKGSPIGGPDDVPPECGVMQVQGGQLVVAREAPRRAVERLPLQVWMALAQAGPVQREDEPAQQGF